MSNIRLQKLRIVKSGILILLPLSIFILLISSSIYIEAGRHLTPFSVNVRGYYRSNGTYVRPHTRRPPGGAIHDTTYESKRSLCIIVILIGSGIFCYSIYSYRKLDKNELLMIVKNEIINEIKNNFNPKLPHVRSRESFPFYYMDNCNEYCKEEERFINDFLLRFKNKTSIEFNNIDYLKKIFKEYIIYIKI